MLRRRLFMLAVVVVAIVLLVFPGVALGKGGGTPNPPPTNPPCNSDNHEQSTPRGLEKNNKCPTSPPTSF